MPRKLEQTNVDAIDILQNEIEDYVIGDYCITGKCPYKKECRDENKECKFSQAIERTITILNRRSRRITELNKENEMLKSLLRKE